jgi:hypothetical protein
MHYAVAGINRMLNNAIQNDNTDLSGLTPDQAECYEKIVKGLLKFCEERYEHPQLAPPKIGDEANERKIYGIVFRQSEDWKILEDKLNIIIQKAKSSYSDRKIAHWAEIWMEEIGKIREFETKRREYREKLSEVEAQLNPDSKSREVGKKPHITDLSTETIEEWRTQEQTINTSILICREGIVKGVNKLIKNSDLASSDKEIKAFDDCKDLLIFFKKNLNHLTVFIDSPEVSMDENKLCAEVCLPKNPKKNEKELEQEFSALLNFSTKAIFEIEELNVQAKQFQYDKEGKVYYPTEVGIKASHYAEATPSTLKRIGSPSIKLTREIFFDCRFAKEEAKAEQEQEAEENDQKNYKSVTALAARLDQIVNLAIHKVNGTLKRDEGPVDQNDNMPKGGDILGRYFLSLKFW